MLRPLLSLAALAAALAFAGPSQDSVAWSFHVDDGGLDFDGAPLTRDAAVAVAPTEVGGGLVFNERPDILVERAREVPRPRRAFHVRLQASVETPQRWGGLVGRIQDNGGFEKGWLVGYDEERFTFALATRGADDGDGALTYLRGSTPYRRGVLHDVVASYDGETMRLYVDGQLDAESKAQSGDVLHPDLGKFVVGAYLDDDESYPHDGRITYATLVLDAYAVPEPGGVEDVTNWLEAMATRGLAWDDTPFEFLVRPYLTWPTRDAISVGFEATEPCLGVIRYRRDDVPEWTSVACGDLRQLHVHRLTELQPDTKYFYQVEIQGGESEARRDEVRSFRTAASAGRAFTFVVIGDTQSQPDVVQRVSDLAFEHRPNLYVHAGDLVSTGSNKRDWTHHFFSSSAPLLAHVPLMPVLGNHEQDAQHFYDYMDLPAPERWYSFTYGDAEFFMLDGNRSLAQQSAQLEWLEGALSRSQAEWRFAVLHHPPYTSDSNDYGDTLEGPSTRGDMNVRNIVALLERHGVDVCFSGHVHDYERTFPIRDGEVVAHEDGGVVYVTAAGGGGHLEDFDRTNTWFGHKKLRRHHFVYVALHGDHLELQAIDEEGRLMDTLELRAR